MFNKMVTINSNKMNIKYYQTLYVKQLILIAAWIIYLDIDMYSFIIPKFNKVANVNNVIDIYVVLLDT